MEGLTWKQVRDFLNTCTDEQLEAQARVSSDDSVIRIEEISIADKDWYRIDDEGSLVEESEIPEDTDDDEIELVVEKGDIHAYGEDVGYY